MCGRDERFEASGVRLPSLRREPDAPGMGRTPGSRGVEIHPGRAAGAGSGRRSETVQLPTSSGVEGKVRPKTVT